MHRYLPQLNRLNLSSAAAAVVAILTSISDPDTTVLLIAGAVLFVNVVGFVSFKALERRRGMSLKQISAQFVSEESAEKRRRRSQ